MKLRYLAIGVIIALIPVAAPRRAAEGRELAPRHAHRQSRDPERRSGRERYGRGEDHRHRRCVRRSRPLAWRSSSPLRSTRGRPAWRHPSWCRSARPYQAKGCATTTAAIAAAIIRSPGAYYVNIHNAKYPGGALRGASCTASAGTSRGCPTRALAPALSVDRLRTRSRRNAARTRGAGARSASCRAPPRRRRS